MLVCVYCARHSAAVLLRFVALPCGGGNQGLSAWPRGRDLFRERTAAWILCVLDEWMINGMTLNVSWFDVDITTTLLPRMLVAYGNCFWSVSFCILMPFFSAVSCVSKLMIALTLHENFFLLLTENVSCCVKIAFCFSNGLLMKQNAVFMRFSHLYY